MVDKVDTKERGRRVLSAPGKPKVGSRAYKDWLAYKHKHGLPAKGGYPAVYTPRHAEARRGSSLSSAPFSERQSSLSPPGAPAPPTPLNTARERVNRAWSTIAG
jgi:hypothetical protein